MVSEEPTKRNVKVLATPAVRRIAQEYGVSLGDVRGSGKEGRVLKEDILAHVEGASPAPAPAFVPPLASRPPAKALQQVLTSEAPIYFVATSIQLFIHISSAGSCSSCSPSLASSSFTCYCRWTQPIEANYTNNNVTAGKDRVEKTNVIVKAMTKTMVEALKIPHFGYKDEVMYMMLVPVILLVI